MHSWSAGMHYLEASWYVHASLTRDTVSSETAIRLVGGGAFLFILVPPGQQLVVMLDFRDIFPVPGIVGAILGSFFTPEASREPR